MAKTADNCRKRHSLEAAKNRLKECFFIHPILQTNPKRFCFYKLVTWTRKKPGLVSYFGPKSLISKLGSNFWPLFCTVVVRNLCVIGIRYLQTYCVDDCLRLDKKASYKHPPALVLFSKRMRTHTRITPELYHKMGHLNITKICGVV